jgi:hypothetical protein
MWGPQQILSAQKDKKWELDSFWDQKENTTLIVSHFIFIIYTKIASS